MKASAKTAQLPAEQFSLLPGYSRACEMIERAASVDEAKSIRDKAEAFRAYAIKARNREMELTAAEIRMRAERKAGLLLREAASSGKRQRQGGDRKSKSARTILKLADLGITPDESARWQRISKLSEKDFELRLTRMRANGKPGSFLETAFASETDEYLTPREVLDAVVDVLGEIDLDPSAETPGPSRRAFNVPAKYHFTKANDGLAQPWGGRVFMNPPYGAFVSAWVERLMAAYGGGEICEAIALVAARTDTAWFLAFGDAPVCFVTGRLKFVGAEHSAPFPSAVFYLGPRVDRFAAAFSPRFGPIYQAMG